MQRIENGNRRTLVDVDLSAQKTRAMPVRSGDSLSIPTVSERIEARIMLSGHVKHPADFQWRRGMTARDVLPSADAFLPQADLDYLLVKRQDPATGALSATSFAYAASTGGIRTASEVILEPHDEIVVFQRGRSTDRSTRLAPLLQQLRDQARAGSPARVVSVNGAVPLPGEYPLEAGMRVSDLLRASGGLAEMASTGSAELTRYLAPDGRQTSPSRASIDLAGILSGNTAADVVLEPYDFLVVRAVPQWNTGGTITLAGEVRSPGTYPIARGEKLSSVIARAGGLTDLAFARGAILLREDLKAREARQLEKLAERMEALLASAATNKLTNPDQEESLGVGSQLLTDLKSTQPTGRLVIDLPGILEQTSGGGTSDADITVVSGDYLYIPPPIEDVTVMGEVFHPNSHVWKKGVTTAQLVAMSGGMTEKADDDRVYVIRADGSVLADGLHDSGGRWDWPSTDTTSIRPGDTVIVPIQVDRMQPLTLWSTVTRMVFDLGVTIAQLERAFND